MTRKEKIKLLQGIKEGRINIQSLDPPQVYVFEQSSKNPEVFTMQGKNYTENEYREFCDKIERKKDGSMIWNERKEYPKEDTIIKIIYKSNYEGFDDSDIGSRNVTLKLD